MLATNIFYMGIWNVGNRDVTANLIRTGEHEFQVVEFRTFGLILTGYDYTLVNSELLHAFERLTDQLQIHPARIVRRSTDELWDNFFELELKHEISPETINSVVSTGESVWHYEHHLFVSDEFKSHLEELAIKQLTFSQGFSLFGVECDGKVYIIVVFRKVEDFS